MKRLLLFTGACCFLSQGGAARQIQPPEVEWERKFGGERIDAGFCAEETTDGGYIVAGFTGSFGAGKGDVYLIKTDAGGNLLWQRTFGGEDEDDGRSVQQTSDGGYILAGHTKSFGLGKRDVYLVKTDSDGMLEWQTTFGRERSDEYGYSVQQTSDGGYIIAGTTSPPGPGTDDAYLLKTDAGGNLVWERTFGGEKGDEGRSVQQTSDGGYVFAGWTWSFGGPGEHVYLVKTDGLGEMQWQKALGRSQTFGHSVDQTSDGGYVVAGRAYGKYRDVYLMKADASGDLEWERTFGGVRPGGGLVCGLSVQETTDGGYVIGGVTESRTRRPDGTFYQHDDVYVIKTNALGQLRWQMILDRSWGEWGSSIRETSDGGYIIGGSDGVDVYLVKLAPECHVEHNPAEPTFVRGDANGDERIDIADVVFVLNYLFAGGEEPGHPDSADANDDEEIDIADAIYLLNYLFDGKSKPPPPFPEPGLDPTCDWRDIQPGP